MVSLKDLSKEDINILLEEAKRQIDSENLRKDAISFFNIKKKDLMETKRELLEKELKSLKISDSIGLNNKIKPIINMIHRLLDPPKRDKFSNLKPERMKIITTQEEWDLFERISDYVYDAIINFIKEEKA